MRMFLAALVAVAASALPASGVGPPVHVATIWGGAVSVTCDTSSYPAAEYPCELDVEVRSGTGGCYEVSTSNSPVGLCHLTVRGPLFARPALSPTGTCSIWPTDRWGYDDDNLTIAFDSGSDAAFHAEVKASTFQSNVQPTTVNTFGVNAVATNYAMAIVPTLGGVDLPDVAPGGLVVEVAFPDITWDCRSTSGGSPASDPDAGLGASGQFAFVRTP